MALSSKVYNTINTLPLHKLKHRLVIANIHSHKLIIRFVLDIAQIGKITRIGQLIYVDNVILWVLIHKEAHNVASNKARATRDYYCSFCHIT